VEVIYLSFCVFFYFTESIKEKKIRGKFVTAVLYAGKIKCVEKKKNVKESAV
jgi:hypothetical protein